MRKLLLIPLILLLLSVFPSAAADEEVGLSSATYQRIGNALEVTASINNALPDTKIEVAVPAIAVYVCTGIKEYVSTTIRQTMTLFEQGTTLARFLVPAPYSRSRCHHPTFIKVTFFEPTVTDLTSHIATVATLQEDPE
jgi:hypothetical protein